MYTLKQIRNGLLPTFVVVAGTHGVNSISIKYSKLDYFYKLIFEMSIFYNIFLF